MDALANYTPTKAAFEVRQLLIPELRSGMILDEDLKSPKTKLLILKEGMLLTPMWIERLGNFVKTGGVQERARVRVPKLPGFNRIPALI